MALKRKARLHPTTSLRVRQRSVLAQIRFRADDPDIARGVAWFTGNQEANGRWNTGRNRPASQGDIQGKNGRKVALCCADAGTRPDFQRARWDL
jgi:hypothetical protein